MDLDVRDIPMVLDINDLQRVLRLSRSSCYKIVHSRGFPAVQASAGGAIRISREALFEWMRSSNLDAED